MNRRPLFYVMILALFAWPNPDPHASPAILQAASEGVMPPAEIDRFIGPLFEGYRRPAAKNAVHLWELRIHTRYPDGTPTETRVQVFIPDVSPDDVAGLYLFAPGSTGLIEPCRASREHIAGIRWGLYRAHVLAFSGQGIIGILPDYIGFEDTHDVQPYFHAESEARVVFSALQAVDQWIRGQFPRFSQGLEPYTRTVAGFSQGGHAAFAAADHNRSMAGSLPIHGVIGYGPTTEIPPLMLTFPSLIPMLTQAYSSIYGQERFDSSLILQERWADSLEYDTLRQCVGGMQNYYPSDPSMLFTDRFYSALRDNSLEGDFPEIARILQENSTGVSGHGVPALVLQGENDIVVHPRTQKRVVAEMRSLGNPVEYRLYPNTRHDTRQRSFGDVLRWIETLR